MTRNLVSKFFLGIALVILFDAIIPQIITLGGSYLVTYYRMIMHILALLFFVIASVIILINFKKFKSKFTYRPHYLILITSWVYLSFLWTENTYATFESVVLLTFTIVFTLFVYSNYSDKNFWDILYDISLIIAVTSIFIVFLLPSFGTMPEGIHEGDWRGAYLHKNGLGNYAAIMNVIFLVSAKNGYRHKRSLIGYFITVILVIGSGSKTAFASIVLIHFMLLLIMLARSKKFSLKLILSFISVPIIFIVIFIINNYAEIALLLGGDVTLTGRLPLWINAVQAISEKPLLGYGYGAFWGYNYGSEKFMADMFWESGKSHNALLDIWLDLGIGGVIIFILFLASTFRRLINKYRKNNTIYSETYLLILLMIVSVSMIDFRILYYNSIIFFLVLYIYFYSLKSEPHARCLVVKKTLFYNLNE